MDEPKRVYGRKYELIFRPEDQCWHVLEWRRDYSPMHQGMSIMTFTRDGILNKLFDDDN